MFMAGDTPASTNAGTDPAFPDDAVEVGRIVGAWGVKGGIKVKPFAADPQALFASKRWYLQPPAQPGRPGPNKAAAATVWPLLLRIVHAREQGEHVVATARDLEDRDAAQALAGARLFVSRSSFPTPQADEFYWVDLIGLAVHNREGLKLGTVAGLLETGPVCVLRVTGESPAAEEDGAAGAEFLIPFVAAYVDRVDLPARCIHVDWQPDY
jgi:16S rRNA processing protein RimM